MATNATPGRPATEKQIDFLTDLGVQIPQNCDVRTAVALIEKGISIRDYVGYIANEEWSFHFDFDQSNFIVKSLWNFPQISDVFDRMTQYNADLKTLSREYPNTMADPAIPEDQLYANLKAVLYSLYHKDIDAENTDEDATADELAFRNAVRTQLINPKTNQKAPVPPTVQPKSRTASPPARAQMVEHESGMRVYASQSESIWDKAKRILGI